MSANSRLDKVRIVGYKSIRDQTVELGSLNVLIGANGAGKSSFIEMCKLRSHGILYHFHDTSESSKVKQMGDVSDNDSLRHDAGNLAACLCRIKETDPDSYRVIVDTVKMVVPIFGDFHLRPNRWNPSKIRLEWREEGSDTYLDAGSLSDGTLRFICMATLLLQPELPSAILLDEPELGLHPYAVAVLSELLASAAERTQVIVSTQSVTLVNQFSPEDVIVVYRLEGESRFRRLTSEEIASWLDDYALGDLWEKNVIGGRPSH